MERFVMQVHIVATSSVESARLLVLLSSLSREITLQVSPAGSVETIIPVAPGDKKFDLLIFDVKCAADIEKIKEVVGGEGQNILFLADDEMNEKIIADFPSGQACLIRKPLSYHKLAEGLGQVGIHLKKLNCWDYKQCGRGLGQTAESGLQGCPVSTESATNAMNDGAMGGRVCWAIGGSFCGGERQGTFASKIINCQECDFYRLVHEEQGQYSESINSILGRMKRKKSK